MAAAASRGSSSKGSSGKAPIEPSVTGPVSGKPDYGVDAPLTVRRLFGRAGWTVAVGLAVWFMNRRENSGPATTLFLVTGAIATVFAGIAAFLLWSSKLGKLRVRDRLLDTLNLDGEEKILDVGCGRGLMTIGAAKRLKTGKVTGVDQWNPQQLSGNSAESARQNAKIEGVSDRVRFDTGDPAKLVFPENQFDVVLSFAYLHHLRDSEDRDKAVREMYRVLKPGGTMLIFDVFHTGRYAEILRECGASQVDLSSFGFLWGSPNRTVRIRK